MAALGKVTNAIMHVAQENTAALVNINLDFSVLKFEAPEEFRGLGSSLSPRRRAEAEDGAIHSTARKLGALFASDIPDVHALIEAYGKRATEIAALPSANPVGKSSHGAFAEHVGADGTSIWATATSGKSVVTMHLLACMLARIFERTRAISIWSELVQKRKEILNDRVTTSTVFHTSELVASTIRIERNQLDAWDASARCIISQFLR
jgi:hypothetical protein